MVGERRVCSTCPAMQTNPHVRQVTHGLLNVKMTLLVPLDPPNTSAQIAGGEARIPGNIAVGFPGLVPSVGICCYSSADSDGWMGRALSLTSWTCSYACRQPLGFRLVCRGHSSALWLKQSLHGVRQECEGAGKTTSKRVRDCALRWLTRNKEVGSLHLHCRFLFCHLDGAAPHFESQKGHKTKPYSSFLRLGQLWARQSFRSPENLGGTYQI